LYKPHDRRKKNILPFDEDISDFDNITFGNDSKGGVKGIDEVPISKDYNLSNVLLVDSPNFNLLSIAQLCDNGYKCKFTSNNFEVTSLDGKDPIFKGFHHESLYLVDFSSKKANLTTCLFLKASMGFYGIEDLVMLAGNNSTD
jgi:hypothetical protein